MNIENIENIPSFLMAKYLRKKGWAVFYLEEEHRECNSGCCWLKLYQNKEKGDVKNIIKKIKIHFSRHDFDLDKPKIINTGIFIEGKECNYSAFKCKRCGEILGLQYWQRLTLPRAMQYGCNPEGGKGDENN